jgi:hypothetical protein
MVGKEYLGMNVDKRGYIHTLPNGRATTTYVSTKSGVILHQAAATAAAQVWNKLQSIDSVKVRPRAAS